MSSPHSTYYEATDTPKGTTYFVLELVDEFIKEFKNLINNISTKQEQKSRNIFFKEISLRINMIQFF
ncbi:hypothetical protein DDB_G0271436 [Dictyostelium discoideum AX4]|uniref:Uncharacterized protein n=1 Tax=Dictyostelium discoideum TaxID=44689 RepID=Q55B52_DICDI|nr:hypothetical protein DDB_G0271436 [Dictyostelium discoideum AX4]EAL71848.1 hypothetical protein DDB_G0271436 [Dictyostelium discoideum AX4]|eukprot:XP_645760.1 hypothetical protein DDB_G0271436 [Dictyostelium discoideum AX4]